MDKAIEAYDNVRTLLDQLEDMTEQLKKVGQELQRRDRQVMVALDALEKIGGDIADEAINKMREIHKESLTPQSTT